LNSLRALNAARLISSRTGRNDVRLNGPGGEFAETETGRFGRNIKGKQISD